MCPSVLAGRASKGRVRAERRGLRGHPSPPWQDELRGGLCSQPSGCAGGTTRNLPPAWLWWGLCWGRPRSLASAPAPHPPRLCLSAAGDGDGSSRGDAPTAGQAAPGRRAGGEDGEQLQEQEAARERDRRTERRSPDLHLEATAGGQVGGQPHPHPNPTHQGAGQGRWGLSAGGTARTGWHGDAGPPGAPALAALTGDS